MKLFSEQLDEAGTVVARFYRGRPKTMTPEERAILWKQQMLREYSVPEEFYSKKFQMSIDEKIKTIQDKYGCSPSQAAVKLLTLSD